MQIKESYLFSRVTERTTICSGFIFLKRILLVEDEYLLLKTVAGALKQAGYVVTAVANGKDALREIRAVQYDICFLDVQLPDANGLELMNIVREISPATKIVIMTALELTRPQLSDLRSRSCRFLKKPFDLDMVRSLVDRMNNGGFRQDDPNG